MPGAVSAAALAKPPPEEGKKSAQKGKRSPGQKSIHSFFKKPKPS